MKVDNILWRSISFKKFIRIRNDIFLNNLKHFKNYLGGTIAQRAAGFISLPIFTRLLSKEDYGIISVFSTYVGIMAVLMVLNSQTAVSRYFFEEKEDFSEYLGTSLALALILFFLSALLLLSFQKFWADLFGISENLIILLCFSVFIFVVFSFYGQLKKSHQESSEFVVVNSLRAYIGIAVSSIFIILIVSDKYLGRIWGNITVGLVFFIYILPKILKKSRLAFNKDHIIYILKFSIPLIPGTLSGVILAQFDRIMIYKSIGASDAGLYSVAYNVGMLLMLVVIATLSAMRPVWFKLVHRKKYHAADCICIQYFSIILIASLILIYFSREILFVLAEKKFHEAAHVIPIVVIGYTFYAIDRFCQRYIGYSKQTIYISLVMLLGGTLNIILNAIFIPHFGYIAGAYTTMVSYLSMIFMSWSSSKFMLKMPTISLYEFFKPLALFFAFVLFYYILFFLKNVLIILFVKSILLVIFSICMYISYISKDLSLETSSLN
jgi:O-antigen/teichoic acid export membrane protein